MDRGHRLRWAASSAAWSLGGERRYRALQARWLHYALRHRPSPEPEVALLPRLVRAGDLALDVGANYGLYTYHLARAVSPGGRVMSFEPLPANLELLRRIVARLPAGSVEVIPSGVSDQAGVATFHVERRADGSPDGATAWSSRRPESKSATGAVRVEMCRLDDCVTGPVKFMKLDVEGAELFALRGAERILREHRPSLLVEVSQATLARQDVQRAQVGDLLQEHGYATYVYDAGRRALLATELATFDGNVIALPAERPSPPGLPVE